MRKKAENSGEPFEEARPTDRELTRILIAELKNSDLLISFACHELRTPLTAVKGYADLVRKKMKRGKRINGWLDQLLKESDRLALFLDKLSEQSVERLSRLKFGLEVFNLEGLIGDLIKVYSLRYGPLPYQIRRKWKSFPVGMTVWGDREKTLFSFSNFLKSLLRYGGGWSGWRILKRKNSVKMQFLGKAVAEADQVGKIKNSFSFLLSEKLLSKQGVKVSCFFENPYVVIEADFPKEDGS